MFIKIFKNKIDYYDMMSFYIFLKEFCSAEKANYQHPIISLFENEQKNMKIYANQDYYKNEYKQHVFRHDASIKAEECDFIVYTGNFKSFDKNDLKYLNKEFQKNYKYKSILLDHSDGCYNKNNIQYLTDTFDYVFRTTYDINVYSEYKNVYPFIIGLSNRIINTIDKHRKPKTLNKILYSHRLQHPVRQYVYRLYNKFENLLTVYNDNFIKNEEYSEIDELHYQQSGRRHDINYYKEINKHRICDVTAGYFQKYENNICVYQIDSWKFWEALYAKCCVITVDLDKFNIKLPNQPTNMVHYIGLTLEEEKDLQLIQNIIDGKIDIDTIANNGHEWLKENMMPEHMFQYVYNIITK